MTDLTRSLQTAISTIVRIQKIMEPSVQTAHGELKMVPPDIQAMRFIAQHPDCMASAVGEFLGVAPTTATSVLDRLVKRGLVSRTRPEDNRRVVSLRLTEEGADAFARLDAEDMANVKRMLDILLDDEREIFVRAMVRIADALTAARD